MNRIITATLAAGLLGLGMQAMAQDDSTQKQPDPASPSSAGQMSQDQPSDHKGMSKSHKAFMKDCMAKAKQSNNGMSEEDMKKSCKDQLKAHGGEKKPVTPQY